LVVARSGDAIIQMTCRDFRESGGELLDGMADAMREVNQRQKRKQPYGGGEQQKSVDESAAQIARSAVGYQAAGVRVLIEELLHGHSMQRRGVNPHFIAVSHQILQTVAVVAGERKGFGFAAAEEFLASRGGVALRRDAAESGVLFQHFTRTLIQFA